MKKIFILALICAISVKIIAQAPQKMTYQAVVRDGNNQLVINSVVGIQISILQGSSVGGAVMYSERHSPSSNSNGLISVEIGGGSLVSGDFTTIDWANGPYFIETEADPTGGTTYTITGTTQLLSVPYAFHAKTAENVVGGVSETDPVFGSSVAAGISAVDTANWNNKLSVEIDGSITNEIQTLSINNDTLYLTNGGSVYLGDYLINNGDTVAWNGYNNTIQLNGTNLEIVDGGGTLAVDLTAIINDADFDTNNEIQVLSLSNDTLYLSNGGSVFLGGYNSGVSSSDADSVVGNEYISSVVLNGSNLETTDGGGTIVTDLGSLINDADADSNNEIQLLSMSNDTLYLTNGGSVYLGGYHTPNTDLDSVLGNEYTTSVVLNGNNLETTDGGGTIITNLTSLVNDSDADSTNELQSLSLNNDTLHLSDGGTVSLGDYKDSIWIQTGNNITNTDSGNVGINISNPDDALDVVGNAQVNGNTQIDGFLSVGNTIDADTIETQMTLLGDDFGFFGLDYTIENVCGVANWNYLSANDNFYFNNLGTTAVSRLYSPWFWVPSGITSASIFYEYTCSLEDHFDGVYVEYWNGTQYEKLYSYEDSVWLPSDTCVGPNSGEGCITGPHALTLKSEVLSALQPGSWSRIRFVAKEDLSFDTGDFLLSGVHIQGSLFSPGGPRASGNIYAEKNIYAGSNVLLGDLAEYFNVIGSAEPGDLIAMQEGNEELYRVSSGVSDPNVIGIYSTAPTLTLNDPKSGIPVGLQGRVPVKVSLENGPIKKGDYLTASSERGKAMKATKTCFVVGRALEDYSTTTKEGKILCLIETGWYNPFSSNGINSGDYAIPKYNDQVKVLDPSIGKDSRIFITMTQDPGHRFWISETGDGFFTMSLSGKTTKEVPFNYFVDNAKSGNQKELNTHAGGRRPHISYTKRNGKIYDMQGNELDPALFRADISEYQPSNIPPETGVQPKVTPENPQEPCLWTPKTGLVPKASIKGE